MRAYDQGCFVRVTASKREVEEFARRWPCFGDVRAMSFTFERKSGDLVDLTGDRGMDGAGVAALADDCLDYAFRTIGV